MKARYPVMPQVLTGLLLAAAGCAAHAQQAVLSPHKIQEPAANFGVQPAPAAAYHLYVGNESSDLVSKLTFVPGVGVKVDSDVPVGIMPADVDGPHGVVVSPDAKYWYVSLAHGTPFGRVAKIAVDGDSVVGMVELGMFPATITLSPDGQFLYVVNFNLHGDAVPSSVSVVYTPDMVEIARPVTCVMPHGSRLNVAGTKQYSACMHDDELVELDARTFQITKRFSVKPGGEGPMPLTTPAEHVEHAGMDMSGGGSSMGAAAAVCSPTWAQPGAGAWSNFVYVACNKNADIVEVDANNWQVTRHIPTGKTPYNLAVTPDGRLMLATLKSAAAVAVIDVATGKELARIATSRPVTSGVAVSPDGLYGFVTNEAVGSTRGTVDIIDLKQLTRVASVDVQYQPGGIDVMPRR
jgi:DNA-binding beta-propeller fold protein YncE